MTDKYNNIYRIPSARAPWWDYGNNGAYFVTICTNNRECYFGDVFDTEMRLSEIGSIAHSCWEQIPQHFPFVKLDSFIVMPNHVHGIIIIEKPDGGDGTVPVETQNFASLQYSGKQPKTGMETIIGNQSNTGITKNKFGPQSKNLGSIIRGFKIGVTKKARQINENFKWQARFHDHIIRNDESYYKISEYIINNPKNWNMDDYND